MSQRHTGGSGRDAKGASGWPFAILYTHPAFDDDLNADAPNMTGERTSNPIDQYSELLGDWRHAFTGWVLPQDRFPLPAPAARRIK